MNGEQIIPPITDPLGKHWQQPHRRFIELDNTHALMSEQTFKGLKEYSTSIPTGRYEGKMWKGFTKGEWYQYYEDNYLAQICNSRNIIYIAGYISGRTEY